MAGRRPKPTAVKEAQGNPGKRALPKDEPKPPVGAEMPDWLKDKVAKKYWPLVTKHLENSKVLTQLDADALALYLDQFARYLRARDEVDGRGMIYTSHTGALQIRPEFKIMDDAHDRMLRILIEFGCTPASRSRVKMAAPQQKKNKFASIARAGHNQED